MKKIIEQFVRYPFFANLIAIVVILAGLWFMFSMKKSFFPERSPRFISVSVYYPGASPSEMDEGVTSIIEQKLKGLVGLKKVNSTSSENSSNIRIEIYEDYDIDIVVQDIKNAVDGITNFPSGAERPFVYKQRSTSPVAHYSLVSDIPLMDLKKLGDKIRDDFYEAGITQFSISGLNNIEIAIEISEDVLNRYNLSFSEIAKAVRGTNRDVSGGIIRNETEEILIRVRSRTTDPETIGNIIVRANKDGSFLRVNDLGTVKLQFTENPNYNFQNGKRNLYIKIKKLNNEDLEQRTEWLANYTDKFNKEHKDAELKLSISFLNFLKGRLDLLLTNGFLGMILVVLALTLFLSFRLSLWVSFGIPFSFLAMFIVANLYGITINLITLMGMILVIGILVDDGIVIAENIYAHFEKGKKPRQAAIDGTIEVLPAVTSSVLTTIVIFLTLFLNMKGDMEFLKEACFVVMVALAFSLIEAFFILPVHVGKESVLSHKKDKMGKFRQRLDNGIFYVRDKIYGKLLKVIIKYKWIFLFIPLGLIFITAGLMQGGYIQSTIFPSIPFDQIVIQIELAPGVGEKATLKIVKEIEEKVWAVNNRLTKTIINPRNEAKKNSFWAKFSEPEIEKPYISSIYTWLNSSNRGGLYIQFRNIDYDTISAVAIQKMIIKDVGVIPEAEKLIIGGGGRFGKPISLGLSCPDYEQLKKAKEDLKHELRELNILSNIEDNNSLGPKELRLKLKKKAYFLGLDQNFISSQIREAFYGYQIQKLQKGKDEVRVWVRYPKEDRRQIGQMENMKIKTISGKFPLSELIDYDIARGPGVITHREGIREINVSADLKDPDTPVNPITEKINKDIIPKLQTKYPNVKFKLRGQQEEGQNQQIDLMVSLVIGLLIVLIIIMINFRSFSQSVIVLLMIPLGWIAAIWGHGIEGLPISLLSSWGFVALTGIIINDSIVFMAKYNSLLLEGYKVKDAVFNAGKSRFRAIMLTSLTTVLGLYPIIWESSFQAQFLKPMAVSLAYGVLIGTIFILIFFPVLILIVNDAKYFINRKLGKHKNLSREEVTTAIKDMNRKIN